MLFRTIGRATCWRNTVILPTRMSSITSSSGCAFVQHFSRQRRGHTVSFSSVLDPVPPLSLKQLTQGSSLSILSKIPINVLIQPEWRDDGEIHFSPQEPSSHMLNDHNNAHDIQCTVDSSSEETKSHTNIVINCKTETSSTPQQEFNLQNLAFIKVIVPEKINLRCILEDGGSIEISQKVEGDLVELRTTNGNIRVKKLRGHHISLHNQYPSTYIYASDVLEADKLSIQTKGRIRAKQLHANNIHASATWENSDSTVSTQDVQSLDEDDEGSVIDISSLYVSGHGGAMINVDQCAPPRRAVRIKSHHGPVQVKTSNVRVPQEQNTHTGSICPMVELGGVNGNCEVHVSETIGTCPENWNSCQIHVDSLSQDSVSLVMADKGGTGLTIDRKVEADLRLLCQSNELEDIVDVLADSEDSREVSSRFDMEETPGTPKRIWIETDAFSTRHYFRNSSGAELIDGWTENKSSEPDSRFDQKVRGVANPSVGKIRIEDAAKQALSGFERPQSGEETSYARPLFVVGVTESISLETVSWLGAIARRYGLDERGRELGRTAARRGRSLEPNE